MDLVMIVAVVIFAVVVCVTFHFIHRTFQRLEEVVFDINSANRHLWDRISTLELKLSAVSNSQSLLELYVEVKTEPEPAKKRKKQSSISSEQKSSVAPRTSDHHTDQMIPVYKISTEDSPSPDCSSSRSSKSCSSSVESYSGGSSYSSSDSSSSSCDSGGSCGGGD